jgi:hypothetical protein
MLMFLPDPSSLSFQGPGLIEKSSRYRDVNSHHEEL